MSVLISSVAVGKLTFRGKGGVLPDLDMLVRNLGKEVVLCTFWVEAFG